MSRGRPVEFGFAAAAGAATSLAFPPTELWPAAIAGLALLLSLLRHVSRGRGAALGGVFGLAFFGTLLSWTVDLGFLAWIALVGSQTAWMAAFGAVVAGTGWGRRARPRLADVVFVALAWGGIEVLRARYPLAGFAWGGLGLPYVGLPGVRDLAALVGGHGIAVWSVAASGILALGSGHPEDRRATLTAPGVSSRGVAGFTGLLVALSGLGFVLPGPAESGSFEIAVVQGNVPKERFTSGEGRRGRVGPEDFTIVENHLDATEDELIGGTPPDLVVWPENSFDRDPDEWPELAVPVQAMIDTVGVPFIVGAIVRDPGGDEYNANLLWEPRQGITDRYDKHHLVPFGEYVPGGWVRNLVPALREQVPTDLVGGTGSGILVVGGVRVGNAICFESTYARDVRRVVDEGAEVILVSTNNATFGESPAAAQHLQASRMRALEHRKAVVHAAISGITGIIDPDGNVRGRTELFTQAVVRDEVALVEGRTLYARIGGELEAALGGLAALALLGALLPGRGRGRKDALEPVEGPVGTVVVAIPTYDEAEIIEETVARVRKALPAARVLVLDDASPDGTGAIVDALAAKDPQVSVVHRPGKAGLGTAYLEAFRRCLADPDVAAVVEIDADGSHDPSDLPRIVGAAAGADVVIGSRYVEGGQVSGWSKGREVLSRLGNRYARLWLGLDVRDATAGYRLYRREVLAAVDLDEVAAEGYAFQVEMTLRAIRAGARVTEVPITFCERRAGASKMSRSIILEALWRIPLLALRRERPPSGKYHAGHDA